MAAPTISGAGSVSASYQHVTKEAAPSEGMTLGGAALKWYDVQRPEEPVPPAVHDEARAFLRGEVDAGRIRFDDELGFVVLHRCGASFYFLIVSTWRGNNEVWSTVYAKDGAGFELWPRAVPHLPTFCVWELGPVLHERLAWTRFVQSDRGPEAVEAYLGDRFSGPV
jgi:hypothetical protein